MAVAADVHWPHGNCWRSNHSPSSPKLAVNRLRAARKRGACRVECSILSLFL